MSWGRGDQAMCVRELVGFDKREEATILRIGRPTPPLIYEVVDVRFPPIWIGSRFPDLADIPFLGLREFRGVWWRSDFFRKLEPLPPELIDLPERLPELIDV